LIKEERLEGEVVNMKKKNRMIGVGMCVLLLLVIPVTALAVPEVINYQGYLTDAGGNPLNGDVGITFRIWSAEVGGTELWSESHAAVAVSDGVFTVLLGSSVPITVGVLNGERYLGLTVGTDSEMVPRMKVTSVAYAIRAGYAESVAVGSVDTSALSDTAVTEAKIATGAVTSAKLGSASVTSDKIASGAVTGSKVASGTLTATNLQDGTALTEIADNDGAGSGLDADMLDGQQGSYYLNWSNITNVPTGFSDGVDDTGITTETDPQVGSNTNNYVPKWDGTALVEGTIYDNGKIGIGTANPGAPLDIASDGGGSSLIVEGSTQFNSNIHGGNNDLLSLVSTLPGEDNASSITFTTSDGSGQTERLRITPEGNVGIGTSSPGAPLDIASDAGGSSLIVEGSTQFNSNIHGGNNDLLSLISTLPGENNASSITFTTSDGSGQTERLRITPEGNVGIGTITPDVTLTIQTPVYGGTALNVGGTSNAKMRVRHIDGKNEESSDTGDLFLQYDANHNTILNANSTGSVGIGTVSPADGYKLDVEGNIQATAFDTGDITFRKNGEILWRMFEEDDGLYLENVKTSKVYRLVLQESEKTPVSIAQLQLKNQELEKRLSRLEALIKEVH
jgi:hypothetical protein